jgi:hypothetical protein
MGGGGVITIFFLRISSSWVNLRLHTENQLDTLPGSVLKVCVVGGWWWWWVVGVESEFSGQLWLWLWPSRTTKRSPVNHCTTSTTI